jgi:hypothetical protein
MKVDLPGPPEHRQSSSSRSLMTCSAGIGTPMVRRGRSLHSTCTTGSSSSRKPRSRGHGRDGTGRVATAPSARPFPRGRRWDSPEVVDRPSAGCPPASLPGLSA